jgi:hypothetical protein
MLMLSDEMMIVLKPDGKLKVWRKTPEQWRPDCLGYMRESSGLFWAILESYRAPRSVINFGLSDLCFFSVSRLLISFQKS